MFVRQWRVPMMPAFPFQSILEQITHLCRPEYIIGPAPGPAAPPPYMAQAPHVWIMCENTKGGRLRTRCAVCTCAGRLGHLPLRANAL